MDGILVKAISKTTRLKICVHRTIGPSVGVPVENFTDSFFSPLPRSDCELCRTTLDSTTHAVVLWGSEV